MQVKLVAYTQFAPEYAGFSPEDVCGFAMRSCHSRRAMHELVSEEEKRETARRIRFAKKVGHFSVLEHLSFTFSVSGVSRILTHQLIRHRIASYSQMSIRATNPGQMRTIKPSTVIGRGIGEFDRACEEAIKYYNRLMEQGVPREDARFILPSGIETHIVVTMNARELLHFIRLRDSEHAQWEIRQLAQKMFELAKAVAPTIFESIPPNV